ncbi:MAG: glycine cleavage system protein H [Acidimicrobiia bacterium]|nr:MAG: glycine cleavage system protein H [Acidimicrobiia bacterium]
MTVYRGCHLPDDRVYDIEGDLWVLMEGDLARIGMTDVAQTRMGKMVSIQFKREGRRVRSGGSVATVESAKWVGPIHTPFDGEIVEPNRAAFDTDVLIANRDPYDAGWVTLMRPDQPTRPNRPLVDGDEAVAAYMERIDELDVSCFRCAD